MREKGHSALVYNVRGDILHVGTFSTPTPPHPKMSLNVRELQPFLVQDVHATGKVLGNGSYGSVEEVQIPGATCVAKKLHEELLPPPTEAHGADRMASLFVSECNLMSSLRHPHIVQFLGVCFFPGSRLPALLMEKLSTDLHNLLEEKPGIPLSMKISILVGIANGLTYLHSRGPPVIHRDLSARNVLLNSAMVAKIADLGNSRIVDVHPSKLMTMTKNPGNAWYMPPEAQGKASKYNTSIDVFSFGNLTLFTLSQKFPDVQPATTTDEETGRVTGLTEVERRSESFSQINEELGKKHPIVELAEQCLENLPAKRPLIEKVGRRLMDIEESVCDQYKHLSKLEMLQLHDKEMKEVKVDPLPEPPQETISSLRCEIEALHAQNQSQQEEIVALKKQISLQQSEIKTSPKNQSLKQPFQKYLWELQIRFHQKEKELQFVKQVHEVQLMEDFEWYFNEVAVADAEISLIQMAGKKAKRGAFLVRKEGDLTLLSVQDGTVVHHYPISRQLKTGGVYIFTDCAHKSLSKLVQHHMTQAGGLCCQLTTICPRPLASTTIDLSDYTNDEWEIEHSLVQLTKKKHDREYCEVWEGFWNGSIPIDIKKRKPGTRTTEEFLSEAEILKTLRHQNVVQLYAICAKHEPILIVLESMAKGILLEYLREEGQNLHLPELVSIASHIANGMAYLEEQQCIHRHLAARNVFIGKDNDVKIGNFGYAVHSEQHPVERGFKYLGKWTAPEVIKTRSFTVKSDVWSFGVLLFEIVTHGRIPYTGMSHANAQEAVQAGYRMPKPLNCPDPLYQVMLDCWKQEPEDRPTFGYLKYHFDDNFLSEGQYSYAYITRDKFR